jgi:predicted Zn finger-like uncharacterized protein
MTLATRCTACHTMFRVVQDQLKVSDGWVRCGRCNEVFDARDNLIDWEQAPAHETLDVDSKPPAAQGFAEGLADGEAKATGTAATAEPAAEVAVQAVDIELAPGEPYVEAALNPAAPAEAAFAKEPLLDAAQNSPLTVAAPTPQPALPEPDLRADAMLTPRFVQQADRAARWQTSGVRIALALAGVLLAATLVMQAVVWQRDVIAAHWKEARPWLIALCQWADCQIQPLRRVDQISVANSGLTRIEGSSLHRFNVSLLNRGSTELMLPALDLSLTDAQGQVISRRVLAASELGVTAASIASGAELPLQAMLSTGSRKVAGYTIELFYP